MQETKIMSQQLTHFSKLPNGNLKIEIDGMVRNTEGQLVFSQEEYDKNRKEIEEIHEQWKQRVYIDFTEVIAYQLENGWNWIYNQDMTDAPIIRDMEPLHPVKYWFPLYDQYDPIELLLEQ